MKQTGENSHDILTVVVYFDSRRGLRREHKWHYAPHHNNSLLSSSVSSDLRSSRSELSVDIPRVAFRTGHAVRDGPFTHQPRLLATPVHYRDFHCILLRYQTTGYPPTHTSKLQSTRPSTHEHFESHTFLAKDTNHLPLLNTYISSCPSPDRIICSLQKLNQHRVAIDILRRRYFTTDTIVFIVPSRPNHSGSGRERQTAGA
ncbi:hypothetical protein F5Y14DRAFT_175462 [Nemania sp. NC0429]|nr:hypothetical protein F5Y14DRAFT_175462 [Nemania sp. NC0429]